ncbi:MAG: SRPBCC family protein [Nitrospirae bacterium]|nr:SRPBCC family protein [Nitrospirota bacterium]
MVIAGGLILIVLGVTLYLPAEYHFGTTITVSRAPKRVWAWFANPSHWTQRFPMVQSIEGGSTLMTSVGTQRRVNVQIPGGNTLTSEIMVTDFTTGRLYADRHLEDWLDGRPLPVTNVTDRLEFDPDGQGHTRITFTGAFEVTGLWNRWLAYFALKPMVDRVIARVLTESAHSMENEHPGPAT